MREITCQNEDGMSVTFGNTFSPFLLEDCDGIYEVSNKVAISDNSMLDGATYLGSVVKMRNIVLTLRDRPNSDHQANRVLLYGLFKPKSPGTFIYREGATARTINYYVESVRIDGALRARQAVVSLLCPDPLFSALSELRVTMAAWNALWEFRHEFVAGGEEFGTRAQEKLRTIENYGAVDNIGMEITITAAGPVMNPSITHVEKAETIKIGTENNPLEMAIGEKIIILTGSSNKHVYLLRDGVRTEINEYLENDSVFIQLAVGANTIGYNADTGSEYMMIDIAYRYKYLGV